MERGREGPFNGEEVIAKAREESKRYSARGRKELLTLFQR